jgi:hypothetical protein
MQGVLPYVVKTDQVTISLPNAPGGAVGNYINSRYIRCYIMSGKQQ